jgi:hypothetical protein
MTRKDIRSTGTDPGEQAPHAFAEFLRLRQQAQNQEGFRLEVVEESRLNQHPVAVRFEGNPLNSETYFPLGETTTSALSLVCPECAR